MHRASVSKNDTVPVDQITHVFPFNVLNHPNFRLPDGDISSPNFGKIQTALDPRVIQLALKFLY
jgi:hypothetical protein